MKIFLGMVLAIAAIVLGICIVKTYREEHKLVKVVRRILIFGCVIILVNIWSLYTTSVGVCLFAYSLYFVSADWMLYYLLEFSIEYIGVEFEHYVKKNLMVLLLVADSISVMLNNVFEHLFSLNEVVVLGGNYFELKITPYFYIHYGIILMLVVFCLISLFYRSVNSPIFYRKKYLTIAIIMVVLVIMNAVAVQSAIDVSVIGYAIEGICIYYCVFVFSPQKLLPKTLFKVAQDMSVGLLVMDIEGKKLYNNGYAESLLDLDRPLKDKDDVCLEKWCQEKYMNTSEEFSVERTFYRDDEEFFLKIELQRMVDENKLLQGGYFVIYDRTEEVNNLKREKYLATHDTLTGLYNKQYFFEKTEKYVRRYSDKELYMVCTDIKDFKMINDFLGTKSGDQVLINFANIIREKIKGAVVYGRIGNDIFGILIAKSDFREKDFAIDNYSDLFAGIDKGASFPIINYIGVYEITEPEIPVSVMCDRARMAVATIKGDYHKRVAYYDNVMRETIMHEQELIHDLSGAIEEGQLKMYLQPQMDTSGRLLGAEALVRWIHPEKGQIMPGKFIPVFEKNGLISDVDIYMWETACKQLRKWKDEGREDLYISVNISPRDFYFLNIYQIFTELIEKYDIDSKNLKLEITETAIVMDFNRQLELITRLRQKGFIVEMDDFGSGYSSLNMLKDLHVDVLKIDMAFLKKAKDEERSKKILKMVIALSKNLDMPVITEGVETAEQVEFLAEMGCDMFQGYFFAKPMPVEDFEREYLNEVKKS